jgi:hypothetical protein
MQKAACGRPSGLVERRALARRSRAELGSWPLDSLQRELLGLFGLQTGAGQRPAKRPLSTGSVLRIDDLAVAIDHDINGIAVRGIHGGQIGISGHYYVTLAGMVFQVLLHDLLGLCYINGNHDQALAGEFRSKVVYETLFALAVRTPRGPELKKNNFPFGGLVAELFAGERLGVEARRGLAIVFNNNLAMYGLSESQGNGYRRPQQVRRKQAFR